MSAEGVKSARRVFQILEFFKQEQRELSVAEVSRHCDFPASSTSALMRTMSEMGYLHFDRGSRTYRPTPRLPLLVGWISERWFREERVLHLMQDLSDATGETIILGAENGPSVRYIHVIEGTGLLRLHAIAGQSRPYAHTAMGLALLSTWERRRVVGFMQRQNGAEPDPHKHVDIEKLLERLEGIRADGFAKSVGGVEPRGGAVAMLLPRSADEQLLAVGIAGLEERVNANSARWIELMQTSIQRHFSDADALATSQRAEVSS
jgi:DNA-binding IclR family transcriptional regulator